MSLAEILAVVVLMGILAAIILPRFARPRDQAQGRTCEVSKGNIEVQAQLWFRNKGVWPQADLSDIGADPTYFPDGLPTCPADGSAYVFDSTTQRVTGHAH
jgi:type II secretory pathway pseudopilin PulG